MFCIYFEDHDPPHVHVFYGDDEIKLAIATGDVLGDGSLAGAKLGQAREWLANNRALALAEWRRCNP